MHLKRHRPSLLLALLVVAAHSACYNYWDGDTIPNKNTSSYCQPIIIWPVSDLVLNDTASRDSTALAYYQEIYNNSYAAGEVDLDCLGVLQYVACAAAYPTCANDDDSIETVCSWLCELMEIRCGTESRLYQEACVAGAVADSSCSFGEEVFWPLLLLLPLLALW